MGKGLAQALLIASAQAFGSANATEKVTTPGYLQYCLENTKPNIISEGKDDGSGYIRGVKLRYRNRGIPGQTVTQDDCSIQVRPAYLETDVPATAFRALGLTFEDDLIAQFERDAMAPTRVGLTNVMKDVYEAIIEQANGIFADINNDLLASQVANFGINVATASNAAQAVNFPLDGTVNNMGAGMTKVMADAMLNEVKMAGCVIVGSGLISNYFLQQPAKSADSAGLNSSQLAQPKFYFDPYAAAAWGTNQFALLEKNAVQFVNLCRFRGMKAGLRGSDYFFTLKLPIVDSLGQGTLSAFEFDVQLSYRNCPEEVQIGVASEENPPVLLARGMNIILSSSYQAVFMPTDSYNAADRLSMVNGTFRYSATNA